MPDQLSALFLQINGTARDVAVEPRQTLLDLLRDTLMLTGTKRVCDMGNCGACTVLVDGRAMYACLLLAIDCAGREITTIEGIARGDELDPVQQAFIETDAFQCGFCTPGKIMPNLEEYKVPTVADMPPVEHARLDLPDLEANETGAKGIGEPPLIPTAPAIANAIFDATGVRLTHSAMSRELVLAGLAEKEATA